MEKPASSAVNVHFFRGIQIFFPRTTTTKITTITKTNKPFLRPRQRSLVVKKIPLNKTQWRWTSFGQSYKEGKDSKEYRSLNVRTEYIVLYPPLDTANIFLLSMASHQMIADIGVFHLFHVNIIC